jgi:hypothetical protein
MEGYHHAGYCQGHIFEEDINLKRGLDIWFPFLAGGIFFLLVSLIQWIFSDKVTTIFLVLGAAFTLGALVARFIPISK